MEQKEKNQPLESAGKEAKKAETPELPWIEVLEPYLKKLFDMEGDENKSLNLKIIVEKYLEKLWGVRYKFIVTNLVGTLIATILIFLFAKPYYDASIVILPDYGAKSAGGTLSGLAAMAGISLGDGSSAVEVYKSLLGSETVIEPVVNEKYYSTEYPDSVNLYTYFKIKNEPKLDSAFQKRKMFLDLYSIIMSTVTTTIDSRTKILTVSVRTAEPQISSAIANNMVKSLDLYVRTKRKSNATMQLMYIEQRVSQINDSLSIAENALKDFLSNNRVTTQSPQLILEQSRLNRQIQIYQTIVIELIRQLEIARIDEIRDAPIINVQEWAGVPIVKAGPKRRQYVILVFILILCFSILFYLFYDPFKAYLKSENIFLKEHSH